MRPNKKSKVCLQLLREYEKTAYGQENLAISEPRTTELRHLRIYTVISNQKSVLISRMGWALSIK